MGRNLIGRWAPAAEFGVKGDGKGGRGFGVGNFQEVGKQRPGEDWVQSQLQGFERLVGVVL